MSAQFVEALKEFIRTGILAAIPVIIDGILVGAVDLRLVVITAAVALLRAVDKYLHEVGGQQLTLTSLDALKNG